MSQMRRHHHGMLALTLSACGAPPATTGFAAAGGADLTGSSTSQLEPSTSSTSTSTSTTTPASSTSTSADTSTANTSDVPGDSDNTTAPPPDFGTVGCAGKVDILFVLSNQDTMEKQLPKMKAALPAFIDTIRTRFAEFDNQILVTDANGAWGNPLCKDCYLKQDDICATGPA